MYQVEVKRNLINHQFLPTSGWQVQVHLDPMELANGGTHPEGKREIADECKAWMENSQVKIGTHPVFGKTDLVAVKEGSTFLIEVEGSSRQTEQAMYSALGQTILMMKNLKTNHTYGLAVPDAPNWESQLRKIPKDVCKLLNLKLYLVSATRVRELFEVESTS